MKQILIIVLVFSTVALVGCEFDINDHIGLQEDMINLPAENRTNRATFKVASWNLQVFGDKKAANQDLMNQYASIMDDYDIIFIQEIRDKDGSAFRELCMIMPGYECMMSSRAGRSISKEQYGLFYRNDLHLVNHVDLNERSGFPEMFERPPFLTEFNLSGTKFIFWNAHLKPTEVVQEMDEVVKRVSYKDPEIVLGDLNYDCNYANPFKETHLDDWYWVIPDSADTTVKDTHCAYDRIVINPKAFDHFVDAGIFKDGITEEVSDHYLVWAEFDT